MNRREAIRALMIGAPAAAVGMIASSSLASDRSAYVAGDLGPEVISFGSGTISVNGPTRIVSPEITAEVAAEVRRMIPAAFEQYSRNPHRRSR